MNSITEMLRARLGPKPPVPSESSEEAVQAANEAQDTSNVASADQAVLKTPEGFPFVEFPDSENPLGVPHTPHHQQLVRFHKICIVDRSVDTSQVYPFLVDCSCGFQARVFDFEQALAAGSNHRGRKLRVA